jgi:ribosomal-protein-alanine N-acetyltransferase
VLGPLPSRAGEVMVRPLRRRDGAEWRRLRLRDRERIERWDVTSPATWEERHSTTAWRQHYALLMRSARRGGCLPFAVAVDGRFVGQVTLGGIARGALCSGWVGYWVSSDVAGRGVGTAAVALTVAHALGPVGLHRVDATIAPENAASRSVAEHLGMRQEGLLRRYLDIHGAWRDHVLYALTAEEMPGGVDPAGALIAGYLRGDDPRDESGRSHEQP